MVNIDDVFNEYRGYVFSFEYDPGAQIRLMKCYFKPDWEIKGDGIIIKKKDNLTYLITKDPNIDFGGLLNFVSNIIKINIEREEKIRLLAEKKKQLEEIFNNSSLDELSKLDFNFKGDDIIPEVKIVEVETTSVSSETEKVG